MKSQRRRDGKRVHICHSCKRRTGRKHRIVSKTWPSAFYFEHKECMSR